MSVAVKERKPRVRLEEPVIKAPPKPKKRVKVDNLTMKLSERALLVDLDFGVWSAKVTDKAVSEEARTRRKATKESGHFTKNLVARKALKDISSAISALKAVHERMTLPWSRNGARILKADAYEEWSREVRTGKAKIEAAVQVFLGQYKKVKAEARDFLGQMFNEDDYPSLEKVASKYYVKVEVMPVPEAGDFRAKLGNREIQILIKDLEARTKERMQDAVGKIYERIADVTEKMFDKLSTYKPSPGPYQEASEGIFRDTLVSNVRELAEMIPVLNITNDPSLDKLREQMITQLCAYEGKELRKDANARARTAKAAKAIYDQAAQFIA